VESDEVLLLFSSFGTPPNTAAMKYLNAKKVPQLFIAATGMKWGDPSMPDVVLAESSRIKHADFRLGPVFSK